MSMLNYIFLGNFFQGVHNEKSSKKLQKLPIFDSIFLK